MEKEARLVILVYSAFASIRALVSYGLEMGGYEVFGAESTTQAREALELGGVDLVILDTEGMFSDRLFEATKGHFIPVVLLEEDGNQVGIRRPSHAVGLAKPFTKMSLLQTIERALLLSERSNLLCL
jgi:DNA-binding NtrC family response regulator